MSQVDSSGQQSAQRFPVLPVSEAVVTPEDVERHTRRVDACERTIEAAFY